MKRIFIFFAMLTLALGCSDLYGPEQAPITPDSAGGVEISISDVADRSFTVTVAPAEESAYYSYLVDESPVAEELNASNLYAKKYTGIAQAAVKYSASPSTTINVTGLKPNTTYQVYAVAGSPMGVVGEVAVKSVTTSDGVNPVLAEGAGADGIVQLAFSEAVTLGEGEMTLRYFARQTSQIAQDIEMGTYTVPAENISCEGNVVTATFAGKIHPGAYYTVDYPEGMFLDSAKNPAAALQSGFGLDEDGNLVPYGVYGRMDFNTWAFDALDVEVVSDPETIFTLTSSVAQIAKFGEGTAAVTYSKDGRTVTNSLTVGSDYVLAPGPDGNAVVYMMLPEVPDFGADVSVKFEEDAFWDIWGNSSEEFEFGFLFSYGYTVNDVTGYYEGAYYGAFDGKWWSMSLTVEESDAPEKGNVMITDGFSSDFTFLKPVYATLDFDGGTLTIPSGQLFGTYVEEGVTYGVAVFASDNSASPVKTPAVFTVPEAGVILDGGLFGFMLVDLSSGSLLGWYDISGGFDIERTDAPSAAALRGAGNSAKNIPIGTLLNR